MASPLCICSTCQSHTHGWMDSMTQIRSVSFALGMQMHKSLEKTKHNATKTGFYSVQAETQLTYYIHKNRFV